ncbi:Y4yA family PLP-dependent enzyme (plasmid) [Nitratireductor aquimarinus]|uniref:Y4yA family PLP-dependent enzyme n=1 Tax=Alphaproteobacteria TaxID=28211 RepID=UPI001C97381F|nr:Y4yA family PLP-dependent enzyme [Tritonibacter mobilis]MBY6001849.1 Y4yA family PLP-dependent enzyme [Tritonibacter mobilis]
MTFHGHKPNAGLSPVLSPEIARVLAEESTLLMEWIDRHGSPLNLIWPGQLAKNLAAMEAVFAQCRVAHAVYYGAKVNKSPGLMATALKAGAGIDVSSLYELQDALHLGADGGKLVATGPAKSRAFHEALIDCQALISVDSPEELDDLIARLPDRECVQPVLLRLQPAGHEKSRFGMPAPRLRACLARIAAEKRLRFDGLHFHISGYAWEERAEALREAAPLIAEARAMGFAPRMIDIGGGLPAQYVDPHAYRVHLQAQRPDDYRTGRVPSAFYPYGGALSAADWLRHLLDAPMGDGLSVADYLKREALTLGLEPGRALADQTALTLFRILRVKALTAGDHVIFVEGSSFSACETWFSSEFLVDPVLLPTGRSARLLRPVRAYIAGHSCLDEDVLCNRWLTFPVAPRAGDILVCANTGGYQMDLLENEFHRHPMPGRLCVVQDSNGQPALVPDTLTRGAHALQHHWPVDRLYAGHDDPCAE